MTSRFPLFHDGCVPATPGVARKLVQPLYEVAASSKTGRITDRIFGSVVKMLNRPEHSLTEVVSTTMDQFGLASDHPYYRSAVVSALQAQIKLQDDPKALERIKAPLLALSGIMAKADVTPEEKGGMLFAVLRQETHKEKELSHTQTSTSRLLNMAGGTPQQLSRVQDVLTRLQSPSAAQPGDTDVDLMGKDALTVAPSVPVPASRSQALPGVWQVNRKVKLLSPAAQQLTETGAAADPLVLGEMDI